MKKHVIPMVEKLLQEYGIFISKLEADCQKIQEESLSISENIQNQEHNFQSLQTRFEIWRKKCDERLSVQKAEQQKVDELMQERFLVRSAFIKNDFALKDQLPIILDATTKNLEQKYDGAEIQKQYIDELIQVMKEQS
ncbi:MAG: hypothetical protein JO129_00795 [Candidatus Dependentiae bacterium]|nr:hypothetical protein [Candidatus Dependentiae bacterium]